MEIKKTNEDFIEFKKALLLKVNTDKKKIRRFRKPIYQRTDEEIIFNNTIKEFIPESTKINDEPVYTSDTLHQEICVNELKTIEKTPQSNENNNDNNNDNDANTTKTLFSRNPFSYSFYIDRITDTSDTLLNIMLVFIAIIGFALIMNCLSRFFDRSDANLLYLTFVSGQKDYFPLVFTGLLMIILAVFSYTINLFVKDKRIMYLIAASMLIFAFFTYFASVSIIEKRYNIDRVTKYKVTNSIAQYLTNPGKVDLLQSKLHCCGNDKFFDWFTTTWSNGTFSVPKSCCVDKTSCDNLNIDLTKNIVNIYQKGCREEILFYFKRNYVDFLIGGFGLVCTLLLEIFACISCFCIRKNFLLNYRANDDNNQNVIIQLSSNSKNIA